MAGVERFIAERLHVSESSIHEANMEVVRTVEDLGILVQALSYWIPRWARHPISVIRHQTPKRIQLWSPGTKAKDARIVLGSPLESDK